MRELLRILSEPLLSSVEAIRWLFKSNIWKHVFRMLLPTIFVYGIIYLFIFVFSFLRWELPDLIPIPLIGNLMLDRFLILVGLVVVIVLYIDDNK